MPMSRDLAGVPMTITNAEDRLRAQLLEDDDQLALADLDDALATARLDAIQRIRDACIATRGSADDVEAYLWRIFDSETSAIR
jgi:hypothetical protein